MPSVTIRETYDLGTTTGKIGLLGVHTPSVEILKSLYPGFLINYKKMKVESCNIAMACASLLPADPLQVGVEAGDIAPQDLFNPVLYRAVSSDSFNTILNRVYGFGDNFNSVGTSSLADSGMTGSDPFVGAEVDEEQIYYSLLSESGWKKSMPQSGLTMSGLVPIVYQVLNNYGNTLVRTATDNDLSSVNTVNRLGNIVSTGLASTFRGPSMPMPAIPTINGRTDNTATVTGNGGWSIPVGNANLIPKTFVAAIVLPPSKLHRMFFRMTISWTVSFFDIVSTNERGTLVQIANNYDDVYGSNIIFNSSSSKDAEDKMDVVESTVDTLGVSADMIMQS